MPGSIGLPRHRIERHSWPRVGAPLGGGFSHSPSPRLPPGGPLLTNRSAAPAWRAAVFVYVAALKPTRAAVRSRNFTDQSKANLPPWFECHVDRPGGCVGGTFSGVGCHHRPVDYPRVKQLPDGRSRAVRWGIIAPFRLSRVTIRSLVTLTPRGPSDWEESQISPGWLAR
jgi:hypothetical protein